MDKPKLSNREAALIAAARSELAAQLAPAAKASFGPERGTSAETDREIPVSTPRNPPPPPGRPDAAELIAVLMQTEQEETLRRNKKLRQYGIVIPAIFLIAALLWVATAIWRYARI